MVRIKDLEVRHKALEKDVAAAEPVNLFRLSTDTVKRYERKVRGLHAALTLQATPLERAQVREIIEGLIDRINVKSVPGLRRKGQGLEVELVGLLPAYLAAQASGVSAWAQFGGNETQPGRVVSVERVKPLGREPSAPKTYSIKICP